MASILIRTVLIYILLSVFMKIMGKRQIGELDVSDLISTLLISELAALPVDDPDIPLFSAVIPIFLIVSLEVLLSAAKNKFSALKRPLEGEPSYVVYKGRLIINALKENRISLNELLCELRALGIGDISDVEYCLIEPNGKLSVIKKKNVSDELVHPIVIDGGYLKGELKLLGMTVEDARLLHKDTSVKDIFLLTLSDSGLTNIILKEEK